MSTVEPILSGETLYGDNFSQEEIVQWFMDEEEAYASLWVPKPDDYRYDYFALNHHHGFRHIKGKVFKHVLGFGSALGYELKPVANSAEEITIIDPSEVFATKHVLGRAVNFVKPTPDGVIAFPDATFDLVTCFGVLHHVPNVSFVVGELSRVLKPGGLILLREPIVSMGDWRHPRRGLTKRERGIPLRLFQQMFDRGGLEVVRRTYCENPLTRLLFRVTGRSTFNSSFATNVDAILSSLFAWNLTYHAIKAHKKIRPTSAFFILRKV